MKHQCPVFIIYRSHCKLRLKIYFTPRPMEPEFYNVLVYMYRFNKIMDRTDISDLFQKITMSQI